jgi:hypothetical protein
MTALAFAEKLMNQPGHFTEQLRPDFVCRLSLGSVSVEERMQNSADVKSGLMPREYAMSEAGIDDVDAALVMINEDEEAQLTINKERATTLGLYVAAGCDLVTAARLAGFEEGSEELALIQASFDQGLEDLEAAENEFAEEGGEPEPEDETGPPPPAARPGAKPALVPAAS